MKLTELCEITSSKRIFAEQYRKSGIPFYRGKEISLLSNKEKIDNELFIEEKNYKDIQEKYGVPIKDDILVTAVGTIGNCFIVDNEKFYFKDGNILWIKNIDRKKILPYYLYYYLRTKKAQNDIESLLIGSTQKALTIENFKKIDILTPSIVLQVKIIKILSILDRKIELHNQINNNLYEIVSQLYQNLFADGEWEEIELKDIANVTSGKRPKENLEEGVYPIIGANGIMGFTSDYNLDNDIIITGRVGTLGIIKRYYKKVWASDNTLIIETKYNNFIENYLKTVDYFSLNRGSTQPLLTQSDLKSQKLLFNKDIVESFELRVKKIIEKIRNNIEENEVLEQLRDTLLPKLMNGEIDLDNIEI